MSYRGRKPFTQDPGIKTDDPEPAAPRPMMVPAIGVSEESGTVAVNSLGFPIAISRSRQIGIKEGLDDITSRLNKALSQYDMYEGIFDDERSEKADVASFSGQTDGRRIGVEDERREFQARYETIQARVDAMERERAELMNSMAEWLEMEPVQVSAEPTRGSNTYEAEEGKSLRDQLVTTKMGFEKLKQISHEKARLDSEGKDTGLLQEESSKLQMKVIAKFKKIYETKKLAASRKTFGAHWKYASDEIVTLLRRIRSEGTGAIEALEEQLERAMNGIKRQAEEMIRLEEKIQEKEEMVKKWSEENAKLTNDNLLLNSEKEKCRDIIRKLKKALIEERRKGGTETEDEDVEERAEGKETVEGMSQRKDYREARAIQTGRRQVKGGRLLCQVCRRRVAAGAETEASKPGAGKLEGSNLAATGPEKSTGGQEEPKDQSDEVALGDALVLEEENDWLTAKVAGLEQTLIEKETQMMKLELQLSELMEAVKASSPQIIQTLCMTDRETLKSLAGDLAVKDTLKTSTEEQTQTSPTTKDTISSAVSTPATGKKGTGPAASRETKRPSKKSTKRRAGEQAPVKPPSQSNLALSSQVSQLTEQRDNLQAELVAVKGQLMRAQRELITLKYASSSPGTTAIGGASRKVKEGKATKESRRGMSKDDQQESDGGQSATQTPSKASETQKSSAKSTPPTVVKYDDEFQAYAELMRKDRDTRPSRRMVRLATKPRQTGGGKQGPGGVREGGRRGKRGDKEVEHVQMEDFVTFDQGMQTDPQMDPLGQWSNVPSLKKRRRTDPLPLLATRSTTDTPIDKAPIAQPPTEWTHFDPTGPMTPATTTKKASISHQMRAGQEPSKLETGDIVDYVDRELGRIIQGINGFTSYLKRLIQREVTDMITTNMDIRKHLSETTLHRLDQGVGPGNTHSSTEDGRRSRALATPIRRGRFEIIKDNKPSKFAAKNAYASLQYGGRRFFHAASPLPQWTKTPTPAPLDHTGGWSTFARDHILASDDAAMERCLSSPQDTICVRLQKQIEMIGQHAVDVLSGTTVFFKETVMHQMEEYSRLHSAFGIRQELKSLMAPSSTASDSRETPADAQTEDLGPDVRSDGAQIPYRQLPLKLTRSTSHNSFLESHNINYDQDRKYVDFDFTKTPTARPVETRSLSSLQSSHRYLPALAVYESHKPRNRQEMELPKATLPRRGLVTLQVKAAATTLEPMKGIDHRRRFRPVAVSHRGLQSRQREILARQGVKQGDSQQQQDAEPLISLLQLKQQIFQLKEEQNYQTSEQTTVPSGDLDIDTSKSLPPLENERRRIIIHAQDQLREPMQQWDKYISLLADGQGPEQS